MNDDQVEITPALLSGVRDGDELAWKELLEILSTQVYGIIRRQVRSKNDHDDLAQEAFTKIFLKLDQFKGSSPFRHWVSRLTINTCYDWLRRHRVRPLVSYSDLNETQAEALERTLSGEQVDQGGNLAAMRELLQRLISTLKPKEQIIIRLLDLEEKSVQEITSLTGWGASNVKVTAMRARQKLATALQRLETET